MVETGRGNCSLTTSYFLTYHIFINFNRQEKKSTHRKGRERERQEGNAGNSTLTITSTSLTSNMKPSSIM